jgi:hypothetical protein
MLQLHAVLKCRRRSCKLTAAWQRAACTVARLALGREIVLLEYWVWAP